jgi:hypothetical protein
MDEEGAHFPLTSVAIVDYGTGMEFKREERGMGKVWSELDRWRSE